MSAVKQAQTAAKVLFDSDYSSINVSDLLSALESDSKLVYVEADEMFTVPLIKMGASTAFFGSVCELSPSIRSRRNFSHECTFSSGEESDKIQWFEIEQCGGQGSILRTQT